jgi:ABC-2 type transport system ATP-binding protein
MSGHDVVDETIRVRELVGYLPEEPFVYDYLNAVDFLSFVAEVRKIPADTARDRIEQWLDFFGLVGREGEFLVNYSQGMKKKISLASALIHDPPVLILDEPTGGLDPKSVRDLREKIVDLAAGGKTILLSTHVLEIAQKICNRIGIISQGRIVGLGTPDELCASEGTGSGDLENVFIDLTTQPEETPEQ